MLMLPDIVIPGYWQTLPEGHPYCDFGQHGRADSCQ